MKTRRKNTGRRVDAAEISSEDRNRVLTKSDGVTRAMRLARARLGAASAAAVKRQPHLARWFCLQLEPGMDFRVEKALLDAGVELLAPREKETAVRRGKAVEWEKPLLPGYMLVRFVPSPAAYDGLKRQKGVFDFVRRGEFYLTVEERDILPFKMLLPADIPRMKTDKSFADGDRAEITVGPFVGYTCLVKSVRWARTARASIVIVLGGKTFEIESIPVAFLKKL